MAVQTLFLRTLASAVVSGTASVKLLSLTQGGATNTANTTVKNAKTISTWQFIPGTAANITTFTPGTTPNSKGWILDGSVAGTYANANWVVTFEGLNTSATPTSGAAVEASLWVVTATSTTVTSVSQVANAVASATFTPSLSATTATVTITSPGVVTLLANQYLYLELYFTTTVAGSSISGTESISLDDNGANASKIVTPTFTPAPTLPVLGQLDVQRGKANIRKTDGWFSTVPPGVRLTTSLADSIGFSPTVLSGCKLWLDATDASTITGGTTCSQWNDKSTNGNHYTQATAANQPAITAGSGVNGFLKFTATSPSFMDSVNSNSLDFVPESTLFAVSNAVSDTQTGGVVIATDNPLSTLQRYFLTPPQSSSYIFSFTDNADNISVTTAAAGTAIGTHLYTALGSLSASTTQLNRDGTSIVTGTAVSNEPFTAAPRIGDWPAGGSPYDGKIHEIILYNRKLTLAEYQKVEGYLAWKYGIQGNLPSGHPYKSLPPGVSGSVTGVFSAAPSVIVALPTPDVQRGAANRRYNDRWISVVPPGVFLINALTDTVTITDALARTVFNPRSLSDTVTITDSVTGITIVAPPVIAFTMPDVQRNKFNTRFSAESWASINPPKPPLLVVGLNDTVTTSATLARIVLNPRAFADTITITDSITRAVLNPRGLTDTVIVTDSVTGTLLIVVFPLPDIQRGVKNTRFNAGAWSSFVPPAALSTLYGTMSDTVSTTDALTRIVTNPRALADTISITDVLARLVVNPRAFSDTVTITDTLARVVTNPRGLTDTFTITDSVTGQNVTVLVVFPTLDIQRGKVNRRQNPGAWASVVPSAALVTKQSGLVDTVAITDALARLVVNPRTLADTATITDSLARAILNPRTLVDTISITDALARVVLNPRSLADTVAITDAIARIVINSRGLVDTFIITDSVTGTVGLVITAFTTPDIMRGKVNTRLTPGAWLSVVPPGVILTGRLADTVTTTDAVARIVTGSRALADTVTISDALARVVTSVRTLADTVTVTDALTRSLVNSRALADTVTLTDSLARIILSPRALADTATVSDSLARIVVYVRAMLDTVATTDSVTGTFSHPGILLVRALTDTLAVATDAMYATLFNKATLIQPVISDVQPAANVPAANEPTISRTFPPDPGVGPNEPTITIKPN